MLYAKGVQDTGWRVLAVVALAAALLATGCAEDGDDTNNNNSDTTSGTSGSTSGNTSGTSDASGDVLSGDVLNDTSGGAGCGAVTVQGECAGTVLTWCDEDENGKPVVSTYDCADSASACELISSSYGYNCVVPAGDACDSFDAPFCGGTQPVCLNKGGDVGQVCEENTPLACNPNQDAAACEGDVLVYECFEGHTVIATDCAALGSVCQVVEDEATCLTAAGGDCGDTFICGGTNPSCVMGVGGAWACEELAEALPCDTAQAVPTCTGDRMVTGCYLGTVSQVNCAALGGTCDPGDGTAGAFCKDVTAGNICEEGFATCAEGLGCTPPSGDDYSTCLALPAP